MSSLLRLGSRLSRDTSIFVLSSAVTVLLAFVTAVIVTRYLSPGEYGRLALYFFFAALLTILYNLASLQGTLLWVFGSSGEEEAEDDRPDGSQAGGKRRALTTGLLLTVLITMVGTFLAAVVAGPLDRLLVGGGGRSLVVLAAISGATGAVWRLVSNVLRFEGKATKYAVMNNARPVIVLACVVVALEQGAKVSSVLAATAIGTLFAIALVMAVSLPNYELGVSWGDVGPILRAGLVYVPLVLAMWVLTNMDLYILSHYASDETVGIYRLANRIGAAASYFVSAFLIAWVPVSRTSIFDAARRERGVVGLGSLLVTYYAFAVIWVLLGLTAGADLLANVAPPAYDEAAPLIPLVGLGFSTYGFFVVLYRAASFPNRRRYYIVVACACAALFLGLAVPLASAFGAYGAAAAVVCAFAIASIVLLWRSERGATPLRIPWLRLCAAAVTAATLYGLSVLAQRGLNVPAIVCDAAAVLLFPVSLVVLTIVPRTHAGPLLSILVSVLPSRAPQRRVRERLARLPREESELLRRAVREGLSPEVLAVDRGTSPLALCGATVVALRRLTDVGESGPLDPQIGRFLLTRDAIAERDVRRRQLRHAGVDPVELHELEAAVDLLRRTRTSKWPRVT